MSDVKKITWVLSFLAISVATQAKVIEELNDKRITERRDLIKNLETPGPGKEIVRSLPQIVQTRDWLITNIEEPCKLFVEKSRDGITSMLQLNNGLLSRTFYVSGNIACVSYKNLSNEAEYIRAVKPEVRIMIDSAWFEVGGLKGQPESSYLIGQLVFAVGIRSPGVRIGQSGNGFAGRALPVETEIQCPGHPLAGKRTSCNNDISTK